MSEHGARRGLSRPVRLVACLATAVLLGTVAFAGSAFADDDSDSRDRPSHSRSSDDSSDGASASSPKPARGSRSAKPDENLPSNIVKGTPCTDDAVACVSLGAQRAWLFKDGVISYGPVPVSTGGPGKQTPVGDHVVQWKHKDHTTSEFKTPQGRPAPMPFAVFFAEGGVAFHEGTLNRRSAGCVRLARKDAQFFYNFLQLGDKVEVRG